MRRAAMGALGAAAVLIGSAGGGAAACPPGASPAPVGTGNASAEQSTVGFMCLDEAEPALESGDTVRRHPIRSVGADATDQEKQTYGYVRPGRAGD